MSSLSDSSRSGRSNFHQVVASFLTQPGLPFAGILSAERIERIFARHGNVFGVGRIYSTAVMVWSFLGQVLRDGKQAAVARVVSYQEHRGGAVPTSDTGDYCRARNKLSEAALRDVSRDIAAEIEQQAFRCALALVRPARIRVEIAIDGILGAVGFLVEAVVGRRDDGQAADTVTRGIGKGLRPENRGDAQQNGIPKKVVHSVLPNAVIEIAVKLSGILDCQM